MKIRTGFVSNSSSSSFIVAYKGKLKEEVEEAFKLPEGHPLKKFSVSSEFSNSIRETFTNLSEYIEYVKEERDDENEEIVSLLSKGYTVATGYFSDDSGNSIETFLCEADIDYESENLVIKKSGGY